MINERLQELGIELPVAFPPAGNYLACVVFDDIVHVGGHGPINGSQIIRGKVGRDLSLEEDRKRPGRPACRSWQRCWRSSVTLTVSSESSKSSEWSTCPGFNQTPAVIDGCSNLVVDVFGDRGRHTRSAVGMAELPFDIAVEIELTAVIRPR